MRSATCSLPEPHLTRASVPCKPMHAWQAPTYDRSEGRPTNHAGLLSQTVQIVMGRSHVELEARVNPQAHSRLSQSALTECHQMRTGCRGQA